jgi:taurine dioxygenase
MLTSQELTPLVGSELADCQLSDLSEVAVHDLRQLLGQRGVVVARDQSMTTDEQVTFGRRLGELHVHPARSGTEGLPPEVLEIHADASSTRAPGEKWHTDVSCDERPPAISMLRLEITPDVGGDTVFASMYAAYDTLSARMQSFLLGLTALHEGAGLYRGRGYGDDKVYPASEHPIVRMHPETGRQALYVNPNFTTKICQLTLRESDMVLRFLYDHIAYNVAAQARIRWAPGTILLWDNRCVQHQAVWDYWPATRHGYRVSTIGERPVPAL